MNKRVVFQDLIPIVLRIFYLTELGYLLVCLTYIFSIKVLALKLCELLLVFGVSIFFKQSVAKENLLIILVHSCYCISTILLTDWFGFEYGFYILLFMAFFLSHINLFKSHKAHILMASVELLIIVILYLVYAQDEFGANARVVSLLNFSFTALVMIFFAYKIESIDRGRIEKLDSLRESLREKVDHDFLTQTLNRRSMQLIIDNYYAALLKGDIDSITVVLCDIDYFKKLNDSFGHDFGDLVLKRCSALLKDGLRESDYVARWGGEEFLIVLANIPKEIAHLRIEELRAGIEECDFSYEGKSTNTSMSFGMVYLKKAQDFDDVAKVIERADELLYLAKNRGRNRVEVSD